MTLESKPSPLPALPSKALITGASGFIGGNLRRALLAAGVDVVAIRRPGSPPAKEGRSVEAAYDDVAALERIFAEERPDLLFHVAGATKGVTYEDFRRANVMPTENLLAAAKKGHPELGRFVLMSSLTSYGPAAPGRPLIESDPRRPIEHYGRSKLEAERLVEAETELPWTILRPGGVYGPGDVDYFELFKLAHQHVNLFFGNERFWMSVVYVDDLVDATLRAAVDPRAVGKGYFVADGAPLTWGMFQAEIVKLVEGPVIKIPLPGFVVPLAARVGELATRLDGKPRVQNQQKAKMGMQSAWTCEIAGLRADLDWAPQVNVPAGVRAADAWYRAKGWY